MRILLLCALSAFVLGGCATEVMTKKECLDGAWYVAGQEDGAAGRTTEAFEARAARCAEFGVFADSAAYFQGRNVALAGLCTVGGGYEFSLRGGAYQGVCPADTEGAFLDGYVSGRWIYRAAREREVIQEEYDRVISSIDYQQGAARRARARLKDPDATEDELEDARNDLDYALREMDRRQYEADDLIYELGRADEALRRAEDEAADWRRAPELSRARDSLNNIHDFARLEDAVTHCTDEIPTFRAVCAIAPGTALRDMNTGAQCARGPAQARARESGGSPEGLSVYLFEAHPIDPETLRPARNPTGAFSVIFDEAGNYRGVTCGAMTG